MKVAQVAVYLDAVQAKKIRDDAEDTVLALDDDIEVTTQIADLNARRLAREALDAKRSIYKEIVDKLQDACEKLQDACEKLNCGEYELLEDN